jgi:hypothetical protein
MRNNKINKTQSFIVRSFLSFNFGVQWKCLPQGAEGEVEGLVGEGRLARPCSRVQALSLALIR